MLKKIYIPTYCLLFALSVKGQSPYFKTFSLPEPYDNTSIKLIEQTENNYIWLGTPKGLFRFDGANYQLFIRKDSLYEQEVTAIYEDTNNQLWVGYKDGRIFFLEKEKLVLWMPEEGLPKVPIIGFVEDSHQNFWFATYGEGLYAYHQKRLYNFNTNDGLASNDIYCLQKDSYDKIWLGTDSGISICSFENKEKSVQNISKAEGLPDEIVYAILPDGSGNCWVGMYDKGIAYIDHSDNKIRHLTPNWEYGAVKNLVAFKNLELWIGTERRGIIRYDLQMKKWLPIVDIDEQFSANRIYDLHRDSEGNIWVAANQKGLYLANRQFEFLTTPFDNIQTILATGKEQIWVGTNKGLFSYPGITAKENSFKAYFPNLHLNVISLYQDTKDNIWIGTFGDGIYCLNPNDGSFRHIQETDGLINGNILSIDGVKNKVFLATLGGLAQISFSGNILDNQALTIKNFGKESGLTSNYIYKVFIDSRENIWIATDGNGISILKDDIFTNYEYAPIKNAANEIDSISLKSVYSITEDAEGGIWFSTAKNGIFQINDGIFSQLAIKEGLRNLSITSLKSNKNEEILIVHPNGIDVLNPKMHHLIYYEEEVGIKNISPHLNAVSEDEKGHIWIADQQQLIRFTPLAEILDIHPKTILKEVSIQLDPIDFQAINCFEHDQNDFTFKYAGLWFTAPEKVKYRYQLIGLNPNWIYSNDAQATYSNLPPGKYIFKVSSSENGTYKENPIIEYAYEILAPIWQRPWFILLATIFTAGLIYLFVKYREQRIQRMNQLEKEKIESQFQALKSQINPHFLFNSFNTLASITEENPEAAVQYIEKFSDFYRNMLHYRDKAFIPLEEELSLVKDYVFLLEKRFGKNLKIDFDILEKGIYIVPLTLQILIENAVKHNTISKNRPLKIEVIQKNGKLIVINNGMIKKP